MSKITKISLQIKIQNTHTTYRFFYEQQLQTTNLKIFYKKFTLHLVIEDPIYIYLSPLAWLLWLRTIIKKFENEFEKFSTNKIKKFTQTLHELNRFYNHNHTRFTAYFSLSKADHTRTVAEFVRSQRNNFTFFVNCQPITNTDQHLDLFPSIYKLLG